MNMVNEWVRESRLRCHLGTAGFVVGASSAEKFINREFFSCVQIKILDGLHTVFPFFCSLPTCVSLLVWTRLCSWPQAVHRLTTHFHNARSGPLELDPLARVDPLDKASHTELVLNNNTHSQQPGVESFRLRPKTEKSRSGYLLQKHVAPPCGSRGGAVRSTPLPRKYMKVEHGHDRNQTGMATPTKK